MRKLAHRAAEEGASPRALFNEFFQRKRTLRFVAIVCLSLLYWLQAAPSYDMEGLRALSSRSLPAFLMIFRVAFVVMLFAVVPIVKGKRARPCVCVCACAWLGGVGWGGWGGVGWVGWGVCLHRLRPTQNERPTHMHRARGGL
jgi:hypothetical protein